ncbi:MAG: glycosyltransferase [Acidobacteriaceae bacterium]|nr:glycosyltransferase [Acidobacteriaceae bacterium]MBV9780642.1 glycosyltransferase [Acidobacteriaceae bacterium]
MTETRLNCVFLGLSITSTWGNGHATTYRSLLKELSLRGYGVTFLERDVPWYSSHREFERLPYCKVALYNSLEELKERFTSLVRTADVVVVGSYVPDGIAVGEWVTRTAEHLTAFYDIDTPVTLSNLENGRCEYLSKELCKKYRLYLSFTGGPTLALIERKLGAPYAAALYCSVDPALYYPLPEPLEWEVGYLGTYAADRQPALESLLLDVAKQNPNQRFVVAGPQYPDTIPWPANVERIDHLPASDHRGFYNSQRFTLNLTRRDMIRTGYSPSVRLFEAAACGVPILTDEWPGLETFYEPFSEIVPVRTSWDLMSQLRMPDDQRLEIADRARRRTLRFHTAAVRAREFTTHVHQCLERINCSKRSASMLKPSVTAVLQ